MPYPAGHRQEVRQRIVESARRLFNRSGFDGVSVDCIMAHAGLTRGGFYTYFESKSDLYAEVSDASSPIRTGKAAGRALTSILFPRTRDRKSCGPTDRASILTMWRIRARWLPCPAMLRAAMSA
jgi:AcrR family transcriptional regulator